MYYFAYGSNLSLENMRRICGWHFTVLDIARLNGFEVGANGRGYLNINESNGGKVMGMLYSLDQSAINALDEFEGHPNVYVRREVMVENMHGQSFTAWVYMEPGKNLAAGKVKQEFLKRVIAGARENHMPESWIKFLKSFCSQ